MQAGSAIKIFSVRFFCTKLSTTFSTLALLLFIITTNLHANQLEKKEPAQQCIPDGKWLLPVSSKTVDPDNYLPQLYKEKVILLGEHHANAGHHLWQLDLLKKLHANNPNMLIGLEMFPRRMQPLLDKWVNKTIDQAGFVEKSEWDKIWAFDFNHYLPLFAFARDNQIPLVGINVDKSLLKMTGKHGWDNIPEKHRLGISDPEKPSEPYVRELAISFQGHYTDPSRISKKAFLRFVQQQLLWDRAMAEALATTRKNNQDKQIIGIVGSWHIINGHGIPHQLKSLGVKEMLTLVPWDEHLSCDSVNPKFADAIFGIPTAESVSFTSNK